MHTSEKIAKVETLLQAERASPKNDQERRKPKLRPEDIPETPKRPPCVPVKVTAPITQPVTAQPVDVAPAPSLVDPVNLREAAAAREQAHVQVAKGPITSEAELQARLAADPNDPEVQAFCMELRTRTRKEGRPARAIMQEMFDETTKVQAKLAAPRAKASAHPWLHVLLYTLVGWLLITAPLLFITLALCVLFLHEHFPSIKLSIPQHVMAVMACGFLFGCLLGSSMVSFAWDVPYQLVLKIVLNSFR